MENLTIGDKYTNKRVLLFMHQTMCLNGVEREKLFGLNWSLHFCEMADETQIWNKVFKNGPSKICGKQTLKNLKWYGLSKQTLSLQMF